MPTESKRKAKNGGAATTGADHLSSITGDFDSINYDESNRKPCKRKTGRPQLAVSIPYLASFLFFLSFLFFVIQSSCKANGSAEAVLGFLGGLHWVFLFILLPSFSIGAFESLVRSTTKKKRAPRQKEFFPLIFIHFSASFSVLLVVVFFNFFSCQRRTMAPLFRERSNGHKSVAGPVSRRRLRRHQTRENKPLNFVSRPRPNKNIPMKPRKTR